MAADRVEQVVKDRLDSEDFLLADAQQVVVVSGSNNDRASGVVDVSGLVNNDRRVARAGDDRSFVAGQGSSRDGRTTGAERRVQRSRTSTTAKCRQPQ